MLDAGYWMLIPDARCRMPDAGKNQHNEFYQLNKND